MLDARLAAWRRPRGGQSPNSIFVRQEEVRAMLGMSAFKFAERLGEMMRNDGFPRPAPTRDLKHRRWRRDEVEAWVRLVQLGPDPDDDVAAHVTAAQGWMHQQAARG
ncbi:MAG: hypothetical protein AAF192_08690 [Pseudomonadota bacterium]